MTVPSRKQIEEARVPAKASEDETLLAELAVRKARAQDELNAVRDELKLVAKRVDLPIIVQLNGDAVYIDKPMSYNGAPVCKVARVGGV